MSERTGVLATILFEHAFSSTDPVVCTPIQIKGNALTLEITVNSGGIGGITITAERSLVGNLAYGKILISSGIWSMAVPTVDTVGTYLVNVPIPMAPKDVIRLSIAPANVSGDITIRALNYESSSSEVSGSGGGGGTSAEYITLVEDLTIDSFFVGKAPIGSATSGAVWQIKKVLQDGSGVVTYYYANGTYSYDKIWDNRATYTYE